MSIRNSLAEVRAAKQALLGKKLTIKGARKVVTDVTISKGGAIVYLKGARGTTWMYLDELELV